MTHHTSSHQDTSIKTSVPRVSGDITYSQFYHSHLLPNTPVIFSSALVKSWPAFDLWTLSSESTSDGHRRINWDYLKTMYGEQEVSVANCGMRDSFGNLECETHTFGEVVEMWERGEGEHLYVKDWHLARTVLQAQFQSQSQSQSHAEQFYTTPDIFKDDWMNAYYTTHTTDDFRFVYIGAAGTFTPLHRDVYCSYSWSTNICGRKRWWLFPPEQTELLFMEERRVSVCDVRDVDGSVFRRFGEARPVVVEQEEGETIFVPSGWYHQVENLTDCISINHNWSNAVNLVMLYTSMCDKVNEVEEALEDVREMMINGSTHSISNSNGNEKADVEVENEDEGGWKREFSVVVQDVVKQDAGWNWSTFWRMVLHALQSILPSSPSSSPTPTLNQLTTTTTTTTPFPLAPPSLRPPLEFILSNIHHCYSDFVKRDRSECVDEVKVVVDDVGRYLELGS